MLSRPYEARINVRCTATGCACEQTVSGWIYQAGERGEIIERPLPKDCESCGHATVAHTTMRIEKGAPIDRRVRPLSQASSPPPPSRP
ncbi:MAG TPA: hypothetical protein VNA04_14060 [Thermoanaerobaculia bacterium]|nr:hypothetical protein [Thermoanaerobaculia bacterium]